MADNAISTSILPYIPPEETQVYTKILQIFHAYISLKRSNIFTIDILSEYQTQLENLCEELVHLRFSYGGVREGHKLEEGTEGRNSEILSQISLVRTPTDVLIRQTLAIESQLLTPLFSKLSPKLFPLFLKLSEFYGQLETWRITGIFDAEELVDLQRRINAFENEHYIDGKFRVNPITPLSAANTHKHGRSYSDGVGTMLSPVSEVLEGQAILSNKLHACYRITRILQSQIDNLSPSLAPVFNRLVEIHKHLKHLMAASEHDEEYSLKEVSQIQEELRDIDSLRHNEEEEGGKGPCSFVDINKEIPSGQAMVILLLEGAFEKTHTLLSLKDHVPLSSSTSHKSLGRTGTSGIDRERERYEELIHTRSELQHLFDDRFEWSTDVQISNDVHKRILVLQDKLKHIQAHDDMHRSSNASPVFNLDDSFGKDKFKGGISCGVIRYLDDEEDAAAIHVLLQRSYRLIYKMLLHMCLIYCPPSPNTQSSIIQGLQYIPLSPAIRPLHAELLTIRKCLMELMKHSPWSLSDLKPWTARLYQFKKRQEKVEVQEAHRIAEVSEIAMSLEKTKLETTPISPLVDTGVSPSEAAKALLSGGEGIGWELICALFDECATLLSEMTASVSKAASVSGKLNELSNLPNSDDEEEHDLDDGNWDEEGVMSPYMPFPVMGANSYPKSLSHNNTATPNTPK